MTKQMFESIIKWQRETFPQSTAQSNSYHLREEVNELVHDLTWDKPPSVTKKEYADCFLLLFGSASLYGLTFDDICDVINEKMAINEKRQWGKVNDQGYVKHVPDKDK